MFARTYHNVKKERTNRPFINFEYYVFNIFIPAFCAWKLSTYKLVKCSYSRFSIKAVSEKFVS